MAPIAICDKMPDGVPAYFDAENNLQQVSVQTLVAGKKIVLFDVPGAFTPAVCSMFPEWAKTYPNNKHVKFLADGSTKYTYALGLELELSKRGPRDGGCSSKTSVERHQLKKIDEAIKVLEPSLHRYYG
eukprot:Gb_09574 [translate_table: standard]